MSGLIPFNWFSRSVSNSMGSLRGATLIEFPDTSYVFPARAPGMQSSRRSLFPFCWCFCCYTEFNRACLALGPAVMILQAFCGRGGLLLCRHSASTGGFEISHHNVDHDHHVCLVFYNPAQVLPPELQPWFMNPMASCCACTAISCSIKPCRHLSFIDCDAMGAAVFGFALVAMRRLRDHYAKLVLQ